MTWVDLVVVGVVAVSAMLALSRGFVREILGLGAWAGAAAFAYWGTPLARPQFERWIPSPEWVGPVTAAALFIGSLLILMLVCGWIGSLVRGSALGGLDRTLGAGIRSRPGCASGGVRLHLGWHGDPDRDQWPGCALLHARLLPLTYQGMLPWVADHLPPSIGLHAAERAAGRQADHRAGFASRPAAGPSRGTIATRSDAELGKALADAPTSQPTTTTQPATTQPATTTTSRRKSAASSVSGTCPAPPPSPRSACTPCSTAARKPPGSSFLTTGARFHQHKGMGLVGDNYKRRPRHRRPARHQRHRPQPLRHHRRHLSCATSSALYADFEFGGFAVAHNGNLTNAHILRRTLVRRGNTCSSPPPDSEVFVHLIAISLYSTVVDRLIDALKSRWSAPTPWSRCRTRP